MQKLSLWLHAPDSNTTNKQRVSDFQADYTLRKLNTQAAHQIQLQNFWLAAAPHHLAQYAFASSLDAGLLNLVVSNPAAAAKIKLTSASLLMQLQNLANTHKNFADYKVTAISVKVQVKSPARKPQAVAKYVPKSAEQALRTLAKHADNTALAAQLLRLADKAARR